MLIREIIKTIEKFAPKEIAWEKDNVGLQIGNPQKEANKIFLTLDLTHQSLETAKKINSDLIITHHPLIFNPIKNLNFENDTKATIIQELIKNDIACYSTHTNLDFTKEGVSFQLARKLGLNKIDFLKRNSSSKYKLITFIPNDYVDVVLSALFDAGAGIIGEYSNCSFRSFGKGSFYGSEKTNPKIGKKNNLEIVDETRVEVVFDSWNLTNVERALFKSHPYETPAYDIYKLENASDNNGFGAVGEFEKGISVENFFSKLKSALKLQNFRYTLGKSRQIRKVAVCGGSGIELLNSAIRNNCDAFVTADIKYHSFQDAEGKILLVDAGHFETEIFGIQFLYNYLKENLKAKNIEIVLNKKSTSPIKFYNK